MKGLGYFAVGAFSFLCAIGFLEVAWPFAIPFGALGGVCVALGLPLGEPKPDPPRREER